MMSLKTRASIATNIKSLEKLLILSTTFPFGTELNFIDSTKANSKKLKLQINN